MLSMGEIWLPTQVPSSTCRRRFPAAVNTPVENDGWDVMTPAALEAGLWSFPGGPVLDNKSIERTEQPVCC